jgi:hypothetical protein
MTSQMTIADRRSPGNSKTVPWFKVETSARYISFYFINVVMNLRAYLQLFGQQMTIPIRVPTRFRGSRNSTTSILNHSGCWQLEQSPECVIHELLGSMTSIHAQSLFRVCHKFARPDA